MFKKKLFVISIKSKLNDLFFIPFLLIVFNNMIFLLFKQKEAGFTYDFTFILQIILTIKAVANVKHRVSQHVKHLVL